MSEFAEQVILEASKQLAQLGQLRPPNYVKIDQLKGRITLAQYVENADYSLKYFERLRNEILESTDLYTLNYTNEMIIFYQKFVNDKLAELADSLN